MMSEITSGSMMVLCQPEGGIIAANQALNSSVNLPGIATLADLATRIDCAELQAKFDDFAASMQESDSFSLNINGHQYQVRLQSLNDVHQKRLVLILFDRQDNDVEQKLLLEAGRVTSRLIHDFKNQMGGLKLYAAYLKKRFADQPEGLEIAEKIVQGLNTMAEQSVLVSKLTRPLELKREPHDPAAIVVQTINDQKMRAEVRNVRIELGATVSSQPVSIDIQQLRSAVGSIIARAIDSSPDGGIVRINLGSELGGARIDISDEGESLSESQRESLFDFLGTDRISSAALDLALARRIIEQHGGEITAHAQSDAGTVVQVKLPV